jgi:hypothetical protein
VRVSPGPVAFSAASVLLLLLVAGALLGMTALFAMPALLEHLRGLPQNAWWFWYREPGAGAAAPALWRIGAACVAALISLAAALRVRAIYRVEQSPVIPFLLMFLFSVALECLRAATALLFAGDGPVSLSLLLTRVIYWGRFVGVLGLLIAALYCTDLVYQKFFLVAGVVLLVSFAMAAYIPFDRTVFLAQLTWKLGDEQSVWFVNLAIVLLAVLTAGAAALTRRGPRLARLAIGVVFLGACRELQFFAVQPAALATGLILQAAGAILCVRAFRK